MALALLLNPVAGVQAQQETVSEETFEQFRLLNQVFSRIKEQYVEDVEDSVIIEAAIRGMLQGLDPHSGYISPEAYREMQIQTRGEYGGVGIEVVMPDGVLQVVAPIDDTPASRAGIQPGDYITHVDGESIVNVDIDEAISKLRGPVNTSVMVTIVREGEEEPFEVELAREIVEISAVRHRVERDSIGYIRLTTFSNEKLTRDLRRAMTDLRAELGPDLKGLVIDLRNNPGGLLDEAISVSDLFLNQGEISSMRGRQEADNARWTATPGDIAEGLPIVVLVNAGSASASEILTGALQDHKRATIVGEKTFGKGVVQSVIPLGPQRALRLTTARYYTPSGRSIQARGIDPDILIEQPRPGNANYRPRREADLEGHINNENGDTPSLTEEGNLRRPLPEYPDDEGPVDYQLQYALDLLEGVVQTADSSTVIN